MCVACFGGGGGRGMIIIKGIKSFASISQVALLEGFLD